MDTATKIASGLERAFVAQGFAAPSVDQLRDAAGVSLRTLYKYTPSRGDMVLAALEHRHRRYIAHVFRDLPPPGPSAIRWIIRRIALWMEQEAERGCLFHAAVSADPQDERLRALLQRHKADVASRAAEAADRPGAEAPLSVIIEGMIQCWPLLREQAEESASALATALVGTP